VNFKTAFIAAAALATAGSAQAANLVYNGDFELGDTGFLSDYVYAIPTYNQGEYSTPSNPADVHPAFASFPDHTADPGNKMMVINGAADTTDWVWYQNISTALTANTNYYFSTWVASVYPESPARLNFIINGENVGALAASSTTGLWQQFFVVWNSGAATSASIGLKNDNDAYSGNDFALDDISFDTAPVPEPATWALMIMGFGTAGAMLRRRRAVAA